MIIGFSGLDGCGKSTIIKALIGCLHEEKDSKRNVQTVWTRVGYTPGINLLKNIARKIFSKSLPTPGRSTSRTKSLKRPLVQRIWITVSLLELIWIFSIKLRVLSFRKVLLLDRQIDDSLIDLKILFGQDILNDKFYSMLVFLLKKLSLKIEKVGIKIDLKTSDYRCSVKFEPFPDLPEEKVERIKLYEQILDAKNFTLVLDGKQDINDSLKLIKSFYF
jgi:hypothetical protein